MHYDNDEMPFDITPDDIRWYRQLEEERQTSWWTLAALLPFLPGSFKTRYEADGFPVMDRRFLAGVPAGEATALWRVPLPYWDCFHLKERDQAPQAGCFDACMDPFRLLVERTKTLQEATK